MTSFAYDITKDGLYIRGYQKRDEKSKKEKIKGIKELLIDGRFSQKKIASIFTVSISFVRKIKKELDAEK